MGSEVATFRIELSVRATTLDAERSKSLVDAAADTDEMVVSVIDQVVHSMAVELSRVTALMETVGPVADLSGNPSASCTWKTHNTRA